MRSFLKILTAACILFCIIILGFVLGWFGPKSSNPGPQTQSPEPAAPVEETSASPSPRTTQTSRQATQASTNIARATPSTTTTNAEWEDKLDAILNSAGDDTEKTKQLYAMLPQLPEDGQVEVAQHLSNLVSDQDYAPLGKMLADPKEPEAVLDILIADLLNRPNATKLPLLLEVARDAQHPKAVEARDLLELYLEEDYGQDWAKWQTKTEQWLKDNPD